MIRSLQLRVNRRTQRYADLIEGQEQAVEPDLIEAVRELADREQKHPQGDAGHRRREESMRIVILVHSCHWSLGCSLAVAGLAASRSGR